MIQLATTTTRAATPVLSFEYTHCYMEIKLYGACFENYIQCKEIYHSTVHNSIYILAFLPPSDLQTVGLLMTIII